MEKVVHKDTGWLGGCPQAADRSGGWRPRSSTLVQCRTDGRGLVRM